MKMCRRALSHDYVPMRRVPIGRGKLIVSVPMRRVSVGRVPMRRVPNRRGYIVMADTFIWFIKYCCIIDVFMRNEICAF